MKIALYITIVKLHFSLLSIAICTYISEGVPSKVIAEMKLQASERVVGVKVICLEARRYSAVAFPVFCACLYCKFSLMEQTDVSLI